MFFAPPKVVLALGSNVGDRTLFLERACERLESRNTRILRRSGLYFTRPMVGTPGGHFVNSALLVETRLRPRALLHFCQQIERELGRVRRERWGPRTIDIDIIFYGRLRLETPELTLPHPEWARRDFVLVPLRELGYPPTRLHQAGSGETGIEGSTLTTLSAAPPPETHILRRQDWPK